MAECAALCLFRLPTPLSPVRGVLFSRGFPARRAEPFRSVSFQGFLLLSNSPSRLAMRVRSAASCYCVPCAGRLSRRKDTCIPMVFRVPRGRTPSSPWFHPLLGSICVNSLSLLLKGLCPRTCVLFLPSWSCLSSGRSCTMARSSPSKVLSTSLWSSLLLWAKWLGSLCMFSSSSTSRRVPIYRCLSVWGEYVSRPYASS